MQAWRLAAMWNMHVPTVEYTCRQARHANTASCWYFERKYHRILMHCIHGTCAQAGRFMWQLLFPTNKASKALREDCVKLAVVEVRSSKLSLFLRGCSSRESPGSCCTM